MDAIGMNCGRHRFSCGGLAMNLILANDSSSSQHCFIMKWIFFLLISALFINCSGVRKNTTVPFIYTPPVQSLHDSVVTLDSLLFSAYNNCKMEVFASLVSEDLEFYHDQGGMTTLKSAVVDGIRNNVCGKVTRILLPGSIEVYPIPGFGAVQMGQHRFHNNREPDAPSRFSRFVHIWKREGSAWRLSRVVSLH